MIGLGTWQAKVTSLVFSGTITVVIADKDSKYDIDFKLPEKFSNVKIRCYDIVEKGNTLSGKGEISLLPGKELEAEVTFNGDKMEGVLNIPFMHRSIKLKDGVRVG